MSGVMLDGHQDTPRKLQELARHEMIVRLYKDILMDMKVCEVEGWDRMEFIEMIRDAINGLGGQQ